MRIRKGFLAAFAWTLLIVSVGNGCEPVGEPIASPDLFNSGRILEPDAGYIRLDCEQSAELPETLAIYCFEDNDQPNDIVVDSTGQHDGKIIGTKTRVVRGPTCCGMARFFSESNSASYIEIPDSHDWDLDKGSISFWVRINACFIAGQSQGLISRASADRDEDGHLGLLLLSECNWAAFAAVDGEAIEVRADRSLTPGKWSHININFGPPGLELYLDGRLVAEDTFRSGMEGSRNPWVIGADTREAKPGTASPPVHFLTGAAIDLLRISSARNKLVFLE
ncbi:MAG: LamG domain-containing protein [Deltaproteobacteria bacterium]|nr:LamG domain-containing protein [Deltaproteobacteria bacterium]